MINTAGAKIQHSNAEASPEKKQTLLYNDGGPARVCFKRINAALSAVKGALVWHLVTVANSIPKRGRFPGRPPIGRQEEQGRPAFGDEVVDGGNLANRQLERAANLAGQRPNQRRIRRSPQAWDADGVAWC